MTYQYLSGLGNEHATEVESGVIPVRQNNPQHHPKGLYAEQVNGTAFTTKPDNNRRSWLYRKQPSAVHGSVEQVTKFSQFLTAGIHDGLTLATPEQLRWRDYSEDKKQTFFESVFTLAVCGDVKSWTGGAIHLFDCSQSDQTIYANVDSESLLMPFDGSLDIQTEMGAMKVDVGEIAVIPRGIKFKIQPDAKRCRGYYFENYGRFLRMPYRGPIGANSMASARHFKVPVAREDTTAGKVEFIQKYFGAFWKTEYQQTPLNVQGWFGNYYPYKYDLLDYNTIGSISFDHPDPSVFTVLTSPSAEEGTANVDFVIFPWRWLSMEKTFRPPYYHRNFMNEFMGLIKGVYDAKPDAFVRGGSSIHNCMSGHGPDKAAYDVALKENTDVPHKLDNTLAFMLETSSIWRPTQQALTATWRDRKYIEAWKGL